MEGPTLKRKVAVVSRLTTYDDTPSSSPTASPRPTVASTNISRPSSPTKSYLSANSSMSANNFRPKAKVNSSATVGRKANSTVGGSSGRVTPNRPATSSGKDSGSTLSGNTPASRPGSPSKPTTRVRNGALSPTFQPKIPATMGRSNLRPATQESRNRALTTDSLRASNDVSRIRTGSVSLHHAVSFSHLQPPTKTSVSISPRVTPMESVGVSDQDESGPSVVRIKAKVSGMARQVSETPSGSSSVSSHPSTRPVTVRTRAPSLSSVSGLSSPPSASGPFYPITTATSAANPHRYAKPRPSPTNYGTPSTPQYQPFSPPQDNTFLQQRRVNAIAKVDPASIPLPPHSPPSSALSFSSRSSVSRSSVSYTPESPADSQCSVPTTHQNGSTDHLRSTLDNLVQYSAMNPREDNHSGDSGQDRDTDAGDTEERKVKAEAKSNRKIADLEITNRSLLAINVSLESAKNRQAKEIRELRRKLRESRLILPPRTFRAVKSSLDHDDTADEEEEEEESDGQEPEAEEGDEIYSRIKVILEGLLETGKRALETKTEGFTAGGKGVAKVLTADEVRTWRDASGDALDQDFEVHSTVDAEEKDHLNVHKSEGTRSPSPSTNTIPASDLSLTSEDEVESMTLLTHSRPSSPLPPILITTSP